MLMEQIHRKRSCCHVMRTFYFSLDGDESTEWPLVVRATENTAQYLWSRGFKLRKKRWYYQVWWSKWAASPVWLVLVGAGSWCTLCRTAHSTAQHSAALSRPPRPGLAAVRRSAGQRCQQPGFLASLPRSMCECGGSQFYQTNLFLGLCNSFFLKDRFFRQPFSTFCFSYFFGKNLFSLIFSTIFVPRFDEPCVAVFPPVPPHC